MTRLGHSPSHWLCTILVALPLVAGLASCNTSDSVGALGSEGSGGSGTSTNPGAGTGGAPGIGGRPGTGGAGTGGQSVGDGAADSATDALLATDARDLAELCASTGGQPETGLCCSTSGDYPSSCGGGMCACPQGLNHTVVTCACPSNTCFSPDIGCGPQASGSGGAQGSDGSR
jgi:hypothetical protein